MYAKKSQETDPLHHAYYHQESNYENPIIYKEANVPGRYNPWYGCSETSFVRRVHIWCFITVICLFQYERKQRVHNLRFELFENSDKTERILYRYIKSWNMVSFSTWVQNTYGRHRPTLKYSQCNLEHF